MLLPTKRTRRCCSNLTASREVYFFGLTAAVPFQSKSTVGTPVEVLLGNQSTALLSVAASAMASTRRWQCLRSSGGLPGPSSSIDMPLCDQIIWSAAVPAAGLLLSSFLMLIKPASAPIERTIPRRGITHSRSSLHKGYDLFIYFSKIIIYQALILYVIRCSAACYASVPPPRSVNEAATKFSHAQPSKPSPPQSIGR